MQKSPLKALQSQGERHSAPSLSEALDLANSPSAPADADEDLSRVRELAGSHGMVLHRKRRERGVRPMVDKDNKVNVTLRLSLDTRRAMELARYELDLDFSKMVELSLMSYFRSQGLRFENLPVLED